MKSTVAVWKAEVGKGGAGERIPEPRASPDRGSHGSTARIYQPKETTSGKDWAGGS